MRVLAIFAIGMLVGLVIGYLLGKNSAPPVRKDGDRQNPWS